VELTEPSVKARRKRGDLAHTADCEPALHGWSPTIRRWVAAQTTPALAAEHWTAAVLQQPGGPVRIPLEAIKSVTIGNLAQVLDHRVTRSLDRSVHVVRFLPGGELRFVYDHQGRLIELATVGLSSRVSDDGTVTFNPPPDSLDHQPARGTAPLQWGCDGKHPVLDHSDQLRQRADRFGLECAMQEWRGWDEPYTFRCASAGHEFPLTARQLSTKTIACTACRGLESLARLRQRTEREGVRCLSTEWTGEAGPYLFECQQGHQWQRSAGPSIPRCPHCGFQAGALARRDPNGLARLRQAAEARGGACLSEAYTTSAARYRFRCAEGHEWETRGRMILDGAGADLVPARSGAWNTSRPTRGWRGCRRRPMPRVGRAWTRSTAASMRSIGSAACMAMNGSRSAQWCCREAGADAVPPRKGAPAFGARMACGN
jgi:hypothetical protein